MNTYMWPVRYSRHDENTKIFPLAHVHLLRNSLELSERTIAHMQNMYPSHMSMNTKYNTIILAVFLFGLQWMTCKNYDHDSWQLLGKKKKKRPANSSAFQCIRMYLRKKKSKSWLWINRLTSGIFFQHCVMLHVLHVKLPPSEWDLGSISPWVTCRDLVKHLPWCIKKEEASSADGTF